MRQAPRRSSRRSRAPQQAATDTVCAALPSRVARSFLKFALPTLPADTFVWASSVNAYYTRSAAVGSMTLAAQGLANDAWAASTLKWSTAPALTVSNARKTFAVTYDAMGGGAGWANWKLHPEICDALAGDGVLTVGVHSTNEASQGWAYLAKKEYDAALAPCVVYALRAPPEIAGVLLATYSLPGGGQTSGTVTLNGDAPTGGAVVSLSTDDPAASVPATVTIPAGQSSANFTITTTTVGGETPVTITATYGSSSGYEVLLVTP